MTSTEQLVNERLSSGRWVQVATLNRPPADDLAELAAQVEQLARQRPTDLIVLPETCRGQREQTFETIDGPTVSAMQQIARRFRTYVICPIDRMDRDGRWNSAILIDRAGKITGVYDKMYPYWPELDLAPPVQVGSRAPVWQTDFGRLGIAICFDVNFPQVWQELSEAGAEVVVWTSAYAGGSVLGAYASIYHYYLVSCTQAADSRVYDLTGAEVVRKSGGQQNVSTFTLDLDRGIYHENFNMDQLHRLLKDRSDEIELEAHLEPEQWFVLRSRKAGVSARETARQYGLEELRAYLARSRHILDGLRDRQRTASG